MPRKKPGLLSNGETKTRVDVTIRQSNLKNEGKSVLYGSVQYKMITVRQILEEMEKHFQSLASKELMFYVAQELSNRMMYKFRHGYAVELLDFGTVFPTMRGSVKDSDDAGKLKKHFDVGFTPSKEAKAAVASLLVGRVSDVRMQHFILAVGDLFTKQENVLVKGNVGLIKGKALKLGGPKYGLYAAPVKENWCGLTPSRDTWIPLEHVITNRPSKLEFLTELDEGTYVLIIETSMSAGGKPTKSCVQILSEVVRVVPANV